MSRSKIFILVLALTMGLGLFTNRAWPDIANTVHNLSTGGPHGTLSDGAATPQGIFAAPGQTTEICIFCHTPHGGASELPLWNHALATGPYSVPDTTDLPSLLTTIQQPDKGSLLCLSCHDGTVAIGQLVNMPGPGSVGSVTMLGVAAGGEMPPGAYGYLGTDLSGTHPISIAMNDQLLNDKNACDKGNTFIYQYPPGGDPVKLRPTNNNYPDGAGSPGVSITTPAGFTYNGGVQCASCHDPHDNTNGDFLVKGAPGASSAICDTCHPGLCP